MNAGDTLGSSLSGLVCKVTHRATGVQHAVKCLCLGLLETEEHLEQLRQEIFIMFQLYHPGVVRLEEECESTSEMCLVQELCHGVELFDRLDKTYKGCINFDDALDIMGSDGNGEEAEESYRKIFVNGSQVLRSKYSIVTYKDFLLLMKGQCREHMHLPKHNPMAHVNKLISAPETQPLTERSDEESPEQVEEEEEPQHQPHVDRFHFKSFEVVDNSEEHDGNDHAVVPTNALRSINPPEHGHDNEKIK